MLASIQTKKKKKNEVGLIMMVKSFGTWVSVYLVPQHCMTGSLLMRRRNERGEIQ